ncbi:hypothetical protein HanIR_Chr15g0741491 [Helianthus annuus]|nr:hypothetical protein HanIR_Chr15g0741491 [Helianthus annuus]
MVVDSSRNFPLHHSCFLGNGLLPLELQSPASWLLYPLSACQLTPILRLWQPTEQQFGRVGYCCRSGYSGFAPFRSRQWNQMIETGNFD